MQQIAGAGNSALRRTGSILPPPMDELSNISSISIEKASVKSPLNVRHYVDLLISG